MSWRVVMIRSCAKLECRMDYLVCRAERETRVHLSEIAVIIVENMAVSLTASLIAETAKRKIKLIFCDEKHNPISENTVLYGAYDTSGCVRKQTQWSEKNKLTVWTYIVRAKIAQQKSFLTQLQLDEASALDRNEEICPHTRFDAIRNLRSAKLTNGLKVDKQRSNYDEIY